MRFCSKMTGEGATSEGATKTTGMFLVARACELAEISSGAKMAGSMAGATQMAMCEANNQRSGHGHGADHHDPPAGGKGIAQVEPVFVAARGGPAAIEAEQDLGDGAALQHQQDRRKKRREADFGEHRDAAARRVPPKR